MIVKPGPVRQAEGEGKPAQTPLRSLGCRVDALGLPWSLCRASWNSSIHHPRRCCTRPMKTTVPRPCPISPCSRPQRLRWLLDCLLMAKASLLSPTLPPSRFSGPSVACASLCAWRGPPRFVCASYRRALLTPAGPQEAAFITEHAGRQLGTMCAQNSPSANR